MADIIRLAEKRGGQTVKARKTVPREAEILFFTGVRYERLGERPVEKGPEPKKSGRRRASSKS